MAEKRRGESLEERPQVLWDFKPCIQQDTSQAQPQAAAGSQSPSPSPWAESSILRQGQLSNLNRSLRRSSRRSGNWVMGMDTARLSVGWGSTRRKGLKEILLQSSQAQPTWVMPSQQGSVLADFQRDQEPLMDGNADDLSLALDPLEHEWMLTIAQGDAESILDLLTKDPSLLSRRDFVTGFTVLHWLAKHGRHEDLIEVITFAERNRHPVDINMLTASGRLTPLHLAALQGHEMVIKVLVGAYGANTSLRDHNGRKAWQYLRADASRELKELSGACEEDLAPLGAGNTNNNCAPSRRGGMGTFKGDGKEARGGGHSQRATPRLSYVRNMFRQAIAFFQEF
ncbi:ankyrin repeat domain-containing protein SOWAHD [Rhineura floridana]|uniref:ankyrin repeat domain-containing protein SOWAHD n=1 Tax=Rhineura floridana TaxID=261503 RepID=UPI002AC87FFA|nr:ankyrin repeat domain-containing protein SOWAHD [Rhineura floridana]XP_061454829.1 ankyrin repeat domain-containing protein SOWAHD [Rhineura floridana]XP_061454830.1 ankyrin repeat domain-containing protein SOWAHD [Rhineura floridana]XP_061454831.1 ankyrin repeat domain-containing protein SOWAHD [Rhineura floridana]XP_061454832.1 ankyrin repeat domain-containing protein SOWAHD [Rhineura floridana]XP_061454833.1 ankyrin repeat domain-containing protein SOWAHD [Rhineura floridana]XP_06145483